MPKFNFHVDYLQSVTFVRCNPPADSIDSIFANFLHELGYDKEFALSEIEFIKGKSKEEYLKSSRIGRTIIGTRMDKLTIYLAYENALNHSSFFIK